MRPRNILAGCRSSLGPEGWRHRASRSSSPTIGGLLALLFSGNSLSFTATIGFVALIGIEIKTTILLVDFTNQLRRTQVPPLDAVRQAGEVVPPDPADRRHR
ncbi:MAG: efflux RND transporter permease subunit [Gemmatimonadales bacterium]